MSKSKETFFVQPSSINLQSPQAIDQLMSSKLDILDPDIQTFANNALTYCWKFVEQSSVDNALMYETFSNWLKGSVHGVSHSYYVYKKAKEIRDSEQLDVSNNHLFILSVIHDLSEYLPLIDHENSSEVSLKNSQFYPAEKTHLSIKEKRSERLWKEEHHPTLMAWIIRSLGSELGIDKSEIKQLSNDIYYHDHFWKKLSIQEVEKYRSNLSDAGKILGDADKLVDGGVSGTSSKVKASIQRCWGYGIGKEYFFRDLSLTERWSWSKRSGGFFDTLTALLVEYTAPSFYFHTNTGKDINELKKNHFKIEIQNFVTQLHSQWWDMLSSLVPENNLFTLKYGIDSKERILHSISGPNLIDLISTIYRMPVRDTVDKDGREFFGYSIYINGEWIDPSIVMFEFQDQLTNSLTTCIDEYSQFAANKL